LNFTLVEFGSSSGCLASSAGGALVMSNSLASGAASARLNVPFPFRYNGRDFGNGANGGVSITSRGLVSFGKGPASAANSVRISQRDSVAQRVYVQSLAGPPRRVRVRFEGYAAASKPGSRAALDVVWEASFWPNNTLSVCTRGPLAPAAAKAAEQAGGAGQ
jgi:hypothetical protein